MKADRVRRTTAMAAALLVGCSQSPERDLRKLGTAIDRADSAEAVRYLDVDRTVSAFVDEFMNHALKTDTSEKSESSLGSEMSEGFVRMMQPAIEAMIKQGVYDLVSGRRIRTPGSLTGGQEDTVSRDSLLQLRPQILASRTLTDTGFVTVEIQPHDRAVPETVEVRMERSADTWRVVRVEGLSGAIMDSIAKRTP